MEIFFEIHKDIPREGPGDNKSTRKAFKMLKKLPKNSKILDVGCGPGMQTIELAKNTDGIIYALRDLQLHTYVRQRIFNDILYTLCNLLVEDKY
ncbi:MAG: hypothetical protein H0S78_08235 [Tissierellales bacterium]|nr:hypothetical protein [Tissierellales bacterium]